MSVSHILYQLLLKPLELVFDLIYIIAKEFTDASGVAILALSLTMNLLLIPLYRRADAIQEAERVREAKLAPWAAHIKKTFSGDERFMMLQTYYRQNEYHPYEALKGSLPLLLEIPFFIGAYRYLTHMEELKGMPFGPIADLGAPDALLIVAGVTINALPILMTLINLVSAAVYTKGLPARDKVQLYGMALIFLVLLYDSPAGLVIYWTGNNLFSLCKNVLRKLRKPRREPRKRLLPPLPAFLPERDPAALYWSGAVFLTLLTGVLIPSAVISSSPEEFVLLSELHTPLLHVLDAFLLAGGVFLAWTTLFYYLAGEKGRRRLAFALWLYAGIAITDYMFFGKHLGTLSAELIYDVPPGFSTAETLVNTAVVLVLAAVLVLLWKRRQQVVQGAYAVLILVIFGMSAYNAVGIQSAMPEISRMTQTAGYTLPAAALSRDGKNVIVLMLDRAIGSYLPYLFQERPELREQFAGFTYYPNTISYGPCTNVGVPAVWGGYEYTPEEMNRRDGELLETKHNEAVRLMPVLFDSAGYEVTVCEPTYAGYSWIPDLSVYDEYPDIHAYLLETAEFDMLTEYDDPELNAYVRSRQAGLMEHIWSRNFFPFSFAKTLPLVLHKTFYNHGVYFDVHLPRQVANTMSNAVGLSRSFLKCYAVIYWLPELTPVVDGDQNTFLMMSNSVTHEPELLREPDYTPAAVVDNRDYDPSHTDRFVVDGRVMRMETISQMQHYHVNMAAMLQLGKWFDYLRENGAYDNTRIIIAADHGRASGQFDDMIFGSESYEDAMAFNPLLLVKDFGSTEFTVDNSFMTNADVPTLALEDLVQNPVNPFTGKPVNSDAKNAPEQHILYTTEFSVNHNNGNTFHPGIWYAVHDDIFDPANWEKLGKY